MDSAIVINDTKITARTCDRTKIKTNITIGSETANSANQEIFLTDAPRLFNGYTEAMRHSRHAKGTSVKIAAAIPQINNLRAKIFRFPVFVAQIKNSEPF